MTDLQRVLRRALLLASLAPTPLFAQPATVRARENLRSEPNGDVIGVLEPGFPLTRTGARAEWLEVDVEGWVWLRSLQTTKAGGHDLIVSAAAGENVRSKPSGAILGSFGRGTLLDEVAREPGWVRVRRRAWIWGASVDVAAPAGPPRTDRTAAAAPPAAPARSAAPAAVRPSPATAVRPPAPGGVGRAGASILAGPGGDTLARVRPGAQMQVLGRQGDWARVRVEGWAWLPGVDSVADLTPVPATPAQLAADPDRFRGRVVSWDLQFLSLEKAERIRTEFFEGEPFLLTRYPSGGYVYVALSPDRLASAASLLPLERIHVVGRVRAPASTLTGSPILDLIELGRARDRR